MVIRFVKSIICVQTERKICGVDEHPPECPAVVKLCKHATSTATIMVVVINERTLKAISWIQSQYMSRQYVMPRVIL